MPRGANAKRAWCFTENNPERNLAQLKAHFNELGPAVKYLVCQLETGEQQTPHFQGYVYFKDAKGLQAVKAILPRAHWTQAEGSAEQNDEYCSKLTGRLDGPIRIGTMPKQGQRSDLLAVAESVDEGKTVGEIAKEHPAQYIKYYRGIENYIDKVRPTKPRNFLTEVWVFYGDAGTGKSWLANKLARSETAGAYFVNYGVNGTWFDGYNSEHTIVLDEFKGSIKFGLLKLMGDRYPLRIDRKSVGAVEFVSRRIIITSNYEPDDWYKDLTAVDRSALHRRIQLLVRFDEVPGLGAVRTVMKDEREEKTDLPEFEVDAE